MAGTRCEPGGAGAAARDHGPRSRLGVMLAGRGGRLRNEAAQKRSPHLGVLKKIVCRYNSMRDAAEGRNGLADIGMEDSTAMPEPRIRHRDYAKEVAAPSTGHTGVTWRTRPPGRRMTSGAKRVEKTG